MLNWNSTREIIISAREIIHQDGIVPEIGGEDNENKGKKKNLEEENYLGRKGPQEVIGLVFCSRQGQREGQTSSRLHLAAFLMKSTQFLSPILFNVWLISPLFSPLCPLRTSLFSTYPHCFLSSCHSPLQKVGLSLENLLPDPNRLL